MVQKSLMVLGGSGFVGQAICVDGVKRGWRVSSLSRSGPPSNLMNPELNKVIWHQGSALDPISFSTNNILSNVDIVIHSIGILMPEKNIPQRSYQEVCVETAKVAIEAAKQANVKSIGYISAADFSKPFRSILADYHSSKEEAEEYLEVEAKNFDKVIIAKPSLMWGKEEYLSQAISLFYNIGTFFAAGLFPRALPVETVAKKMLDYLENDKVKGFNVLQVEDLIK